MQWLSRLVMLVMPGRYWYPLLCFQPTGVYVYVINKEIFLMVMYVFYNCLANQEALKLWRFCSCNKRVSPEEQWHNNLSGLFSLYVCMLIFFLYCVCTWTFFLSMLMCICMPWLVGNNYECLPKLVSHG